MSLHEIGVNRLRTALSLLGITIGIFAIISVLTMVDAMESNIRDSINQLGDDVLYVQKWPWTAEGGEFEWWHYWKRPQPSLKDLNYLENQMVSAGAFSLVAEGNRMLEAGNNSMDRVKIQAVTHDFPQTRQINIEQGRYFMPTESHSGKNVAVIGADVADALFFGVNPLGKKFKIDGLKTEVIGVMKKEGSGIANTSTDELVIVPYNYAYRVVNIQKAESVLMVKARDGVELAAMKEEVRGLMRSVRRLRPKERDDFALNEASLLTQGLGGIFDMMNMVGWVIGLFSIVVGGFSIANIMFVTVKERTRIIGIQKSLGARRGFILFQFLFESVFLCIIGGGVGLLFIWLGTILAEMAMDMEVALTLTNIFWGLFISIAIGLLSGVVPAYFAARLDPVIAIRAS